MRETSKRLALQTDRLRIDAGPYSPDREPARWQDTREMTGKLKSQSSRSIIQAVPDISFVVGEDEDGQPIHRVWQQSFKAIPLWSTWMIWQKINYTHSNPVKARLVKSVGDYPWSSYNSFYFKATDPMEVDRDWWRPDDVRKLSIAANE